MGFLASQLAKSYNLGRAARAKRVFVSCTQRRNYTGMERTTAGSRKFLKGSEVLLVSRKYLRRGQVWNRVEKTNLPKALSNGHKRKTGVGKKEHFSWQMECPGLGGGPLP